MHLNSIKTLSSAEWVAVENDLHQQGFAIIPGFLSPAACDEWASHFEQGQLFRRTIDMQRYRFGEGVYKYFNYPLPSLVQTAREMLYERLAPIANRWAGALKARAQYPATHAEFIEECVQNNQLRPTPLLLTYGPGGHNTLHQDLYGDIYFPLQAVFFLKQVGKDYEGGEFVVVEQRPRAQSRAHVLNPGKGDLIIFATSERPVQGSRGYYRVQLRHGVSTVHRGHRMTLGIPFHDAR